MGAWHDPMYRARLELPSDAEPREFAGVPVGVSVTDTDPTSAPAQWMGSP